MIEPMIHLEHHSNLVILSDGLKDCIRNIHTNALMAEEEAKKVISGENTTPVELMRPLFYKSGQRYAELNFLMYSAFFLEAYINIYDYTMNFQKTGYSFESLSRKSTSQKWQSHFPSETKFLEKVRDLFAFRNFLVHSKPIRRTDSVNEVFVQGSGWTPVTQVSSLVTNELGLFLENIPIERLIDFQRVINSSVDLIESKSPGFNAHYRLRIDSNEQIQEIATLNRSYEELGNQLKSKLNLR